MQKAVVTEFVASQCLRSQAHQECKALLYTADHWLAWQLRWSAPRSIRVSWSSYKGVAVRTFFFMSKELWAPQAKDRYRTACSSTDSPRISSSNCNRPALSRCGHLVQLLVSIDHRSTSLAGWLFTYIPYPWKKTLSPLPNRQRFGAESLKNVLTRVFVLGI